MSEFVGFIYHFPSKVGLWSTIHVAQLVTQIYEHARWRGAFLFRRFPFPSQRQLHSRPRLFFFFHFNFTILPSRSLYILQHFRFSLYLPVWYTIR